MTGPRFSRVDMDAVAPLMPSDKTAAVVGGKGVHYEFSALPTRAHSATPLSTRAASAQERSNPSFSDLSGLQFGRMRVVGIAERTTNDGMNWVVRCVCGNYETRKAKVIRKCIADNEPDDDRAICSWCLNTRKLQRGRGSKAEENKWRSVLGKDFPA